MKYGGCRKIKLYFWCAAQSRYCSITPEEHPSFKLLKYCKAAEHIPAWKLKKPEKVKNKKVPQYKMQFEMPLDTDEDEKESFDLSDGIDCRKLQTVKERDI